MDSNVALWLSLQRVITEGVPQSRNAVRRYTTEVMSPKKLQRVITDEVAQSSIAWCANNRGGNRPKSLNPSTPT